MWTVTALESRRIRKIGIFTLGILMISEKPVP